MEQQGCGQRERGSRGFTLLEALVAIALLALSFTTLLSAYRSGLQGVAAIDDHVRARLMAQSLLAEWTQHRALQPGQVQGRHDRFAWLVSIAPFDEVASTSQKESGHWRLHKLTVAVSWPHGRQVELNTLRLLRVQ